MNTLFIFIFYFTVLHSYRDNKLLGDENKYDPAVPGKDKQC